MPPDQKTSRPSTSSSAGLVALGFFAAAALWQIGSQKRVVHAEPPAPAPPVPKTDYFGHDDEDPLRVAARVRYYLRLGLVCVLWILFIALLISIPWFLAFGEIERLNRFSTRFSDASETIKLAAGIGQVIAGLLVVLGAYVTWRKLAIDRDSMISTRLSSASTALGARGDGKEVIEVRLGAIYGLEALSKVRGYYWPCIEILCGYVRHNCQLLEPKAALCPALRTDLRSALRVLGRSSPRRYQSRPRLGDIKDLRHADLRGAELWGYNLSQADFSASDLGQAYLYGADLRSAKFERADLTGAKLQRAKLSHAILRDADLTGANFTGADVRYVDFSTARPGTMTYLQFEQSDPTKRTGAIPPPK